VKRDIQAWLPKIKPGGTIAGDDYWWVPDPPLEWERHTGCGPYSFGVWKAVEECLGSNYEVMVRRHWAIWYKRL
jgi:hypothetical protein